MGARHCARTFPWFISPGPCNNATWQSGKLRLKEVPWPQVKLLVSGRAEMQTPACLASERGWSAGGLLAWRLGFGLESWLQSDVTEWCLGKGEGRRRGQRPGW